MFISFIARGKEECRDKIHCIIFFPVWKLYVFNFNDLNLWGQSKKCKEAELYRQIQVLLLVRLIPIIRAIKSKRWTQVGQNSWIFGVEEFFGNRIIGTCTACCLLRIFFCSQFGCASSSFTTFAILNAFACFRICLDNFVLEIFATVKINAPSTFLSLSWLRACDMERHGKIQMHSSWISGNR